MGKTELVIVLAIILFAVFIVGWSAHWLFRRFNRFDTSNVAELDHMATALHDAEETRDQAMTYVEQREEELTRQLGQTEAELAAAMEGLGEARREAQELRTYIEETSR